jgi:phosphatidylethanolamine/phosphatidyl-N-methylethanolamine N-methyltransferase
MNRTARRRSLPDAVADQFRFLKGLATLPSKTGAVAPSGAALARLMASTVDPDHPHPVLELGPGTGVVTRALIQRGVAPRNIVALEYNPAFAELIAARMPGVRITVGDAYHLDTSLPEGCKGPFSAVVSSLPLLTRPEEERIALLEDALDRMAPGGCFIQFSYSLFPPVRPIQGRFTTETSKWVMMNLPPARVWLYRREAVGRHHV